MLTNVRLAKTWRYFKLLNFAIYCDGWTQVAFGEKSLPKLQIIFKLLPVVDFSFYSFLLAKCSYDHRICLWDRGYPDPLDNDSGIWNMDGPLIQTGYLSSWVCETNIWYFSQLATPKL